jgi:cytochrome P450
MQAQDNPLLSPETLRNPYPAFAAMREAAAVHYIEPLMGSYVVCRHEDVLQVLNAHELFSSDAMRGFTNVNSAIRPEVAQLLQAEKILMVEDPPIHTRMRNVVSHAFTPRRVAELEPVIRAHATKLLDAMLARGETELMADLAIPLPVTVISELLGIEPARRHDFKRWTDDAIAATTPAAFALVDTTRLESSIIAFNDYMQETIERRRREPRNDLISALVEAAKEDDFLSPRDLIFFCLLLLAAGNETTTHLIGNGVIALVRDPSQWERLVAQPSLIPNAVEEMLRYEPSIQASLRRAKEETVIGGHTIPKDARVLLMLGAANRDPRKFADPDRFDVTRDAQGHLTFTHGIHTCLGAHLARLEARVVFEELVRRVRRFEFAPGQADAIDYGTNLLQRGPKSLRLVVQPC